MVLSTECLENLALFITFTIFLLWTYREKIIGYKMAVWKVLWKSIRIVFIFSFTIETLQLFLRLGTWQLSDLFYNTLGGAIGGLIYWVVCIIKRRFTQLWITAVDIFTVVRKCVLVKKIKNIKRKIA